jgi:hypothetical protein
MSWKPIALVAAGAIAAGPLWLAAVNLPYTFTNGTVANADEINANFAALAAAVGGAGGSVNIGGCGETVSDPAFSCRTIYNSCGVTTSGVRYVSFGKAQSEPVWCDMETSPGGWTLLLSYNHGDDLQAGAPNLLTEDWNPNTPAETSDYSRDWRKVVPESVLGAGSQIMLKRMNTGDTQAFTVLDWVGWDQDCNQWDPSCPYDEKMTMFAEVEHPVHEGTYYFHACNGPDCHGTNTYEAIGVDCHAAYPSNYSHSAAGSDEYVGGNTQNCAAGRDPDLWGFGATSPSSARRGSWGNENNNIVLGRVAFYFRE